MLVYHSEIKNINNYQVVIVMEHKVKSPSYPSNSLGKSIEFTKSIFEKAFKGEIHPADAVNLMGYKGMSGPASSALSSLKKFGLLEGRADGVKVSELALKILQPLEQNEKSLAVAEAFMKPELYATLIKDFAGIPDDEVIRPKLIRMYNFSSTGAETFIRAFRESVEYARQFSEFQKIINPSIIETEKNKSKVANAATFLNKENNNPTKNDLTQTERLRFKLSEKVFVDVVFEGEVTYQAIEKLAKLLEITKDSYPSTKTSLNK